MHIQLRIRDDLPWAELSKYLEVWTQKAASGFAFHHDLPGNSHYHVYLFDIEITKQAIRERLAKRYGDRQFSVMTTCGGKKKMQITPILAYQYGTTKDLLEPVWVKINEMDLAEYKSKAQKYYYFSSNEYTPATLITREEKVVVKTDKVWEKLLDQKETFKDKSIKQIKSSICADYLNNGKAIPRGCDLHRYAVSLFILCKYEEEVIVPDFAMENYLDK